MIPKTVKVKSLHRLDTRADWRPWWAQTERELKSCNLWNIATGRAREPALPVETVREATGCDIFDPASNEMGLYDREKMMASKASESAPTTTKQRRLSTESVPEDGEVTHVPEVERVKSMTFHRDLEIWNDYDAKYYNFRQYLKDTLGTIPWILIKYQAELYDIVTSLRRHFAPGLVERMGIYKEKTFDLMEKKPHLYLEEWAMAMVALEAEMLAQAVPKGDLVDRFLRRVGEDNKPMEAYLRDALTTPSSLCDGVARAAQLLVEKDRADRFIYSIIANSVDRGF